MSLKEDVTKDLLCVAAHGTPTARGPAANLLFYYWPSLNPTHYDRRNILSKFNSSPTWKPPSCCNPECSGSADAVKVCKQTADMFSKCKQIAVFSRYAWIIRSLFHIIPMSHLPAFTATIATPHSFVKAIVPKLTSCMRTFNIL